MAILSPVKSLLLHLKANHWRPHNPLLFALEIAAGLGFCLLLAFGLLLWRLAEGPVSLEFLHDRIESTINAELSNARAEFSRPVIMREKGGGIRLRLVDIKVLGSDDRLLAAAPMATVSMGLWGSLVGHTAITRMILIRPTITLSHGPDGQFSFGIADSLKPSAPAGENSTMPPERTGMAPKATHPQNRKALWSALFTEKQFNLLEKLNISPQSRLTHIGVNDAHLVITDELSGAVIRAGNTDLVLNRTKTGYTLSASTRFKVNTDYSSLSFKASFEHGGAASVETRFKDLIPAEFAHFLANPIMGGANLPLSGTATFSLDSSGTLLRASADIEAGAGLLEYGEAEGDSILIDEADISLFFDSATDSIAIEQGTFVSGYNRIQYSGKVGLVRNEQRNVTAFDLALSSSKVALALDSEPRKPVVFKWASLKAKVTQAPFAAEIIKARIGAKNLQLDLSGYVRAAPRSPEIHLEGSGRFISAHVIKRLWPASLAPGTRQWIGDNVKAGYIKDARFKIHLAPGEVARARTGTPIPDDHIQVRFNVRKARFTFMKGLPPIENANGQGLLAGDRLDIRLDKGYIKAPSGGRVKIVKGRFTIPKIHEDVSLGKTNGYVRTALAGPTKTILEILDMKPLEYISVMNIKPQSVGGTSTGNLQLHIPLERDLTLDRIAIKVKANLKNTRIRQLYKGVDLDNGNSVITLNNKGLEAKGKISLNGVPFTLKWNERFTTGKKFTTRFELGGTMDDKARKALGLELGAVIRGPASINLVAKARRGKVASAHIKANLKKSLLKQSNIKWKKPAGVPASLSFDLDFTKQKQLLLHKIDLKGKDLKLTGAIRLDDQHNIIKLDMGHVQLGRWTRFSLSGRREKNGVLHLKAKGKRFDARPLLKDLLSAGPSPGGAETDAGKAARITLEAEFAESLMLNDVRLKEASVKLLTVADMVEALSLRGKFSANAPLNVKISRTDKTTRILEINSRDGGALLRGADYYTKMRGGNFELHARMKTSGGRMKGKVRIENFSIAGEPALKSIMSSSRIKGKKGVPPNADKVDFNKLKLNFERIPGVMTIKNALIAGPSIGATARGRINHVNQTLQIAGTLVPAYGLNAVFGKIPVLGRFLSGRKGEGLIGITFGIQGPLKHPVLTLNPASALAPGFLRMLFEFNSGVKAPPLKPPKSIGDK